MAVRATMTDLITRLRTLIGDPSGPNQLFDSQMIQDYLDSHRQDVRYEPLTVAPTIVNNAFSGGNAVTIYADFYSKYGWWEGDVVLQGNTSGQSWVVLTPLVSDLIVGHWQFETNVFATGTAPGQYPPVVAVGKIYDRFAAAAELLDMKIASLATTTYNFATDGQSFQRGSIITTLQALALTYRRKSWPRVAKMTRDDTFDLSAGSRRLMDGSDAVKADIS